jgi:hypothetical protein
MSIHKTIEIKDFLIFFACLWKDPDPIEAQKLADPTNPDLEHYLRRQSSQGRGGTR